MMPRAEDPARVRARDIRVFDGPIPRILDDVLDWAAESFETRVESTPDGRVFDVAEYPWRPYGRSFPMRSCTAISMRGRRAWPLRSGTFEIDSW